jgi:hypothetical protein
MTRLARHSLAPLSLITIAALYGAAATGVAACGSDAGTERDSAGVRIVMVGDNGRWTETSRPTLREVVRIGQSADTNYQIAVPIGIGIGSDGAVYVLDQQVGSIRVYDSAGKYLKRISRRGNGPGEISMGASALLVTSGDTLLVADMARQLIALFDTEGKPAGEQPFSFSEGMPVRWLPRGDGNVVVQVRQINLSALMQGRGAGAAGASGMAPAIGPGPDEPDRLLLRSPSGKLLDTLLAFPAGEALSTGGEMGMRVKLFASEPIWSASADGRVFYGVNSEYSVREFDSTGTLSRIFRRRVERVPVTEEDKAAVLKAMTDRIAAMGLPAEMLTRMQGMFDFAEFFPAIGQVLAGPDGTLWVQQAKTPDEMKAAVGDALDPSRMNFGSKHWDVFDVGGALLGVMDMPENFTPLHWDERRLVGVEMTGAGGEPSVVVLELSGGAAR